MTDKKSYLLSATAFEYSGTVNPNISPLLTFSCEEGTAPYAPVRVGIGAEGAYFAGPTLRYRVDQAEPKSIRFPSAVSGSFVTTAYKDVNELVTSLIPARTLLVQIATPLRLIEASYALDGMADDFQAMLQWCPNAPLDLPPSVGGRVYGR